MLYKKNAAKTLQAELFRNPTAEYRGTPFWAWNDLLTKEELERQIDVFKEMGLGGFHMHVRTGLKNRYLSDEYMALIKACVEKAKSEHMLAWLYDEDRWPSGAAGGLVTKDERFRARCLLFTNAFSDAAYTSDDSSSRGGRSGKGTLLACYDVVLSPDGCLQSYRRIEKDEPAAGKKWYAFLEINQPSTWYNNQTYADTLNKEAIERFLEVTHERYLQTVGDEFDKTVPAIFTDEPQFSRRSMLQVSDPEENTDVTMPWTDKVPALYREIYGCDILDTLPEIFWELPNDRISVHRYRYHDFIAELFASSFADTVGGWCDRHNIYLTGHMMEEPSLHSQTAALGEAMRSYRSFGLPGIDLLCNNHEFTTAKQAQSAAHQFGKEGVLSELYGVTGWDCDFRTYKHQGDWQAALGITVRVPHLSWYSMQGEAKRDYPASISYQSPWYKEWGKIEDHFARVNTALTRGKAKVKIAVVHPVESFWLHWGPNDKTASIREDTDARFQDLTRWLVEGCIDFDFISESLFPQLCEKAGAPLRVGEMAYDAVIVPGCETLRSTTLERLEAFQTAGGRLIFLGGAPTLENAVPSERGRALYDRSEQVEYAHAAVLSALENERLISMRYDNGRLTDEFLYQLRADTDGDWLFIAHTKEPGNKDLPSRRRVVLTVKGEFAPQCCSTETGEITALGAYYQNGNTVIKTVLHGYDSLLLKLIPGRADRPADFMQTDHKIAAFVTETAYALTEPNVLLLDTAEYALDGGTFRRKEEILRLDNILREELGLPERGGHAVQPWTIGDEPAAHTITLRFAFDSEIDFDGAFLALEDAAVSKIVFNGEETPSTPVGNFVDISIFKVRLPKIRKGENVLTVTQPFGARTNTENMFILGDFGVRQTGETAVITALPEKIRFGDLTKQGFPFYGGTVKYSFPATATGGSLTVHAPFYRGALIKVFCDGKEAGHIIDPPYTLTIKDLSDGEHTITLELFIHRYNTFGPVHLVNEKESWHGPGAWRSDGDNWSYQYVLRRTGVLKSPEILEPTK